MKETKEKLLLSGAFKEVGMQTETGVSRENLRGDENCYCNYMKELERQLELNKPVVINDRSRSSRSVTVKTNGALNIVITNTQ